MSAYFDNPYSTYKLLIVDPSWTDDDAVLAKLREHIAVCSPNVLELVVLRPTPDVRVATLIHESTQSRPPVECLFDLREFIVPEPSVLETRMHRLKNLLGHYHAVSAKPTIIVFTRDFTSSHPLTAYALLQARLLKIHRVVVTACEEHADG